MTDINKNFEEAARLMALPAPSRSLKNPAIGPVIKDALQSSNSIYFAELHDDVNMKFLADNPAIFKEAKAQGAKYMFSEIPVSFAPTIKAYYDGKISDKELQRDLNDHFSYTRTASRDSPENMSKNLSAYIKTAKDN